ncbi:sigma-54 dependent transcriptional regulator [Candidatus Liberibacter sp.]|uniref:sigma-54-dependent transcriptional regulator n=1 Tax=Candidatus Liberibacter sp. TaxID=34022 RepID=UPI0021756738|nr:sigma-54 dependent transcriptional regulator [Candidatus Liberibacter sp.]
MSKTVLILDKDCEQCMAIKILMESCKYDVLIADDLQKSFDFLCSPNTNINVIFLSLVGFGEAGIFALKQIVEIMPNIPVIVQTNQDDFKQVFLSLQNRAFGFVFKPLSAEQIIFSIKIAMEIHNYYPIREVSELDSIIAVSPAMIQTMALARKAAECSTPIIIKGEFGVGKRMLAHAIHASGPRASFPFITVNCRVIEQDKMEKILFGGTNLCDENCMQYFGKFIEANGGTLFIEEPNRLSLEIQEKLLRVIETREIKSVYSRNIFKLDVRLIFSTRESLIEEAKTDNFRQDLYYKISSFPIMFPALRRRREDIPYLVRSFVQRFCRQYKINYINCSSEALAALMDYNWSGNVRELENVVLRSILCSKNFQVTGSDVIPFLFCEKNGEEKKSLDDEDNINDQNQGVKGNIVAIDCGGEIRRLSDIEKEMIELAMELYQSQMSEVARRLGIGRSTLYRKLKEYDLDIENQFEISKFKEPL